MTGISVDEEGISPLERGRRLYQQKDYPGALGSFTEAIQQSTGNLLLTALDHRAASYEKMGQLQAALRDSKRMIDLKPDLAKGYLRCGKVLQVKGEKDLAMKLYERGLRKVKIGTDNDRTILQSMFNRLRRAQDPGKSLDPLAFLPIELAEMVMQNLGMRDRVICLAVSKPWKFLLESSYKLWTTFDTTSARRPVSLHSFKMHLRRSRYTLDNAIISLRAKFDGNKMKYLTQTCKQLTQLQIHGIGVIGDSLTTALPFAQNLSTLTVSGNCEISLSAVLLALKTCQRTLVEATFLHVVGKFNPNNPWPKLESLRSLNLRTPHRDSQFMNVIAIRNSVPNIRSLTLIGCSHHLFAGRLDFTQCKHLEYLHLSTDFPSFVPFLPPTLKHLNLSVSPRLNGLYVEDEEIFDLPMLESFDCGDTALPGTLVKQITFRSVIAGNLKRLSIGGRVVDYGMRSVEDEYPVSESVAELSVASLDISEERIIKIIKLYPNIRKLDVSRTKVTGVAIKDFVNMGITWVKCNDCYYISPDAVEYARGNGVEVEFTFPSRTASFRDSAFAAAF